MLSLEQAWARTRARDRSHWVFLVRGYKAWVARCQEALAALSGPDHVQLQAIRDFDMVPHAEDFLAGWATMVTRLMRATVNAKPIHVRKEAPLEDIDPESIDFPRSHRLAMDWLEESGLRLVRSISRENKDVISSILSRAIEEGWDIRRMKRAIKQHVGLHARYSRAVTNYERKLEGQGLPGDRIDRMVDRYRAKLISARAEAIARTETITARNVGHLANWQTMQSEGDLPTIAQKVWIAAPNTACQVCLDLMGQQPRSLSATWETPMGIVRHPPAHPNCRCSIGLV